MSGEVRPALGDFPAGSRVASYQIEQIIGRGGMAVVYLATDVRLDRPVALKILSSELGRNDAFRQRFIRESRAGAAVDHPHVIPVFEAGEADGVLFIAMRYVAGSDIRGLIDREGKLPAVRTAEIVGQAASALDAAHTHGLVHRDVKPANILIASSSDGRAVDHIYLSDFGLSKQSVSSPSLTGTGQFLGTLDYMSPEQISGRQVDGRTDQYALACAAFEMLAGEPPFRREANLAVMWAQVSAKPPPVRQWRPELSPAVDAVITRALAKMPDERYANCREFAQALHDALVPASAGWQAGSPMPPVHPATELASKLAAEATVSKAVAGAGGAAATGPAGPAAAAAAVGPAAVGPPASGAVGGPPASGAVYQAAALAETGPAPVVGSGYPPGQADTGPAPGFGSGYAQSGPGAGYGQSGPGAGYGQSGPGAGYGQSGPGQAQTPGYGPGGTHYGPGGPHYGPGGSHYGPGGSQYGPGGPQFGASAPGFPPPQPPRRRNKAVPVLVGCLIVLALVGAAIVVLHLRSNGTPQASQRTHHVTTSPHGSASGTPVSSSTASPTSPASQAARPTTPVAVVKAYYGAINAHQYRRAWQLNLAAQRLSDYETFKNGFTGTAHDSVTVTGVSGDVVSIQLAAEQTDNTTKYYQGSLTVQNGTIVAATIEQVK